MAKPQAYFVEIERFEKKMDGSFCQREPIETMVGAIGFESTIKRSFNNMQVGG
ncbi:MAG: hypothetical protein WA824_04090 [Candidatus Sulfotelmatobacter sp.]